MIDTSGLSIGQLKEQLFRHVPRDSAADELLIDILTFGFKFGIPIDADLVFDVRFLTNPYYVPDLKPLSGLQTPVRDYVLGQPAAGRFIELVVELLELTVPAYRSEGKTRLTVALGCTGGYHRSIALAEELAERLREHRRGLGRRLPPGAGAMKGPRLPRWLYPGMHLKRWLLRPLLRDHRPRPGRRDLHRGLVPRACRDDSFIVVLTGAGLDRPIRAAAGRAGRDPAHRGRGVGADAQHRLAVRDARRLACSRCSTPSATWPAARGSWRSAAEPASRPCCAA